MRKLSPRDPLMFVSDTFQGLSNYIQGDYEEAVNWARKAIQQNAEFLYPHFNLAAAYGQLGRLDEARDALAAASQLQPAPPKAFFIAAWPFADPTDMEVFLSGLSKAGVPGV